VLDKSGSLAVSFAVQNNLSYRMVPLQRNHRVWTLWTCGQRLQAAATRGLPGASHFDIRGVISKRKIPSKIF